MIAIIPARGGSKGVPKKNIRDLCGKPLISYTIEAALNAPSIESVFVSTDSIEIAQIAKAYGAEVPFLRPADLATDTSEAPEVYIHMIEQLKKELGKEIDKFIVLLPTAPFRTAKHIEESLQLFNEKKATTLISMKEAEIPIAWYYSMDDSLKVKNAEFGKRINPNNRQDAEKYYVPNGAIYILDYDLLKHKRTYYCDNTIAYIMSMEDSVDIDTKLDFQLAEFLMNYKNYQ